jgi:hypothetical protein
MLTAVMDAAAAGEEAIAAAGVTMARDPASHASWMTRTPCTAF